MIFKPITNAQIILILLLLSVLPGAGQVKINELQAINFSTRVDQDFSAFSDWVELYNNTGQVVDLNGYFLTDNLSVPDKWQFPEGQAIPPGGYLLVWCDGNDVVLEEIHTSFKLNGDGEELALFTPDFVLVDSISFGSQVEDISYGRQPDGSNNRVYFAEPTPLAPNSSQGYPSAQRPADPIFSAGSGFYDQGFTLTLTPGTPDAEIRYTTDGSIPGSDALLYTQPIVLTQTTVINARCFLDGILPGDAEARTYFIDEPTSLPVMALTIVPGFLWDPETGIYVDEGVEYRTSWVRNGKLEYFDSEHQKQFTRRSHLQLCTDVSPFLPQKSFTVRPESDINYPVFPSQPTGVYSSFILRSSGDDWPYTLIRDALMQSLVKDILNVDHQAYRPCAFFINGEWFGIHNLRENPDKDFLASYHNIDPDNVDIVMIDMRDTTISSVEGDLTAFNEMVGLVTGNDLSIDENYQAVKEVVDLDNFIDFTLAGIFFSNTGWNRNMRLWREKSASARWRWLLYDLDRGMTPDELVSNSVIKDLDTTDLFFPHLNQNQEFRNRLINRLAVHLNSTFATPRVNHFIDSLAGTIEGDIPAHSQRWKDECNNQGSCGIQSYDAWIEDINALKGYTDLARPLIQEYIAEFYGLSGTAGLTIHIEGPGRVLIDGLPLYQAGTKWTFFKDVPLQLEAVPDEGAQFLEWEGLSYEPYVEVTLSGDLELTVRFGIPCTVPQVIDQNMVLDNSCPAWQTTGPVTVLQGVTLTIDKGVHLFISPGDSIHVFGTLQAGGTAQNQIAFRSLSSEEPWGCIFSGEGNIQLNYVNFMDETSAVSVTGGSVSVKNCKVWHSPWFDGDIFSIHDATVLIENCTIEGPSGSGKADAIDCDGVSSAVITGNTITGTTDDGIDIGNGSTNVMVPGNRVYDCQSMGISVGESSQAWLERNIIADCEAGIQVHTDATVHIEHNTLYQNQVGIRCFHYENQGTSGGHATVANTIISQSEEAVYEVNSFSTIEIEYSLSDTDPVQGVGNLFAAPYFVDPAERNFHLQPVSPCIDAGDPDYQADPDGSRTDIGALWYNPEAAVAVHAAGDKIRVVPNPSNGNFEVVSEDPAIVIASVEIFNQQGKLIYHTGTVNSSILKVRDFYSRDGLFMLRITTADGKQNSARIVVVSD